MKGMDIKEKIDILGLDIFETHKEEMEVVELIQKYFNQGIGWHYYLDLAWIVRQISELPRGSLILDAGAGRGMAQFILAELGYNVISADFVKRTFSTRFAERYAGIIHYINDQGLDFDNPYTRHLQKIYEVPLVAKSKNILSRVSGFIKRKIIGRKSVVDALTIIEQNRFRPKDIKHGDILKEDPVKSCGRIFVYRCDVKDMSLLPDDLVDGVVSISALEHNNHEDFEKCMSEILRVTKPAGVMAITVSASQSEDWFHEPSKGWCYSEASLKKLFRLPNDVPSNYSNKDILFDALRKENNDLHKRLAPFYFKSGDNGMPWGKWDPQYQPVGVVKLKKQPL